MQRRNNCVGRHCRGVWQYAPADPSRASRHGGQSKKDSLAKNHFTPNPREHLAEHKTRALHYIADTIYITGENRMVHRVVTRHGLDEYLTDLKTALDGLTPVELYWQPSPNANHIAWLVWHMARVEDNWYSIYIAQGDPVWITADYCTRFRLPAVGNGSGHSAEDVAAFPVMSMADVLEYFDAVRARTLEILDSLTEEDLSQTRHRERGDPPPTVAWVMGHVLIEQGQHLGQVAYLRGILRGIGN